MQIKDLIQFSIVSKIRVKAKEEKGWTALLLDGNE